MSDPSGPPSSSDPSVTSPFDDFHQDVGSSLPAQEAMSGPPVTPISTPPGAFPQNLIGLIGDDHPPEFKKEGDDWVALFNPSNREGSNVNLLHTLEHSSVLEDEAADREGSLYLRGVCFSPDGKYLATGAEDKLIKVWNIEMKTIRNIFEGHTQEVYSIDYSSDGQLIVSGSGDKTVRVWNMEDGTSKLFTTHEDNAGVTSVRFSSDGRYVAAGYMDDHVRIWEVATGQLVERLRSHQDCIYSVAFTPGDKGLVSGSLDNTLKHWDVSNLSHSGNNNEARESPCTMTFVGHKDFVLSVAVSRDGKHIASSSKDRGVIFWDPRDATAQCLLRGHKNSGMLAPYYSGVHV
ncbi:general transcription repressor [Marasmius tenuissimus]|uniref:General transcription repressor n=1 Tax=Marasmius tenuissimus TaxID=585030 RepID=A0ABR3A3G4_9AGAR